ncbi:MAG TPA: VWA domain-containing protein [Planctomycetota bacterium]
MSRSLPGLLALLLGTMAYPRVLAQDDAEPAGNDVGKRVERAIAEYEATKTDKQKAAQQRRTLIWLGEIDHPLVVDYLRTELTKAGDTEFAAVVLDAIAKVARPVLKAEMLAVLQRASTPVGVRAAAATAVGRLGDRGIDQLIELARPPVEEAPAKGDAKSDPKDDAAKHAAARQKQTQDAVRRAAVGALVDSKIDRALRALAPMLLEGPTPARLELLRRMKSVRGIYPVSEARIKLVEEAEIELAATAWHQLALERHDRAKDLAVVVLERVVDQPTPVVAAELIGGVVLVQDPDLYPLLLRYGSIRGDVVRRALRASAPAAAADRALMTWLVQKGLETDKPAAREAAKLLLLEAPLEVVQPIVAKARAAIRSGSKKALDFAIGLHELLAKDPTWTGDLVRLVASPESGNRIVGLSLLLELGSDVAITIAQQNLDHRAWELRSICLRYLTRFRDTSSIPLLIDRFEREEGRLLHELHEALYVHTGTRCWRKHDWETWWEKHRVGFALPAEEWARSRYGSASGNGTTVSYFDIPLVSSRVAFVVDTSGSMLLPMGTDKKFSRLEGAKQQLTKVLEALPGDCHFNLLTYATKVDASWEQLRPANVDNKQEIQKRVNKLVAEGNTNIFDAVELAFQDPDVDTIYLLTDGQPTTGRLVAVEDILDEVLRWNRQRQIVLHCIGLGIDSDLLKRLAQESGGSYKYLR